jgi:hypothetical protein
MSDSVNWNVLQSISRNRKANKLANPKYRIGQMVDFNPARPTLPASIREYKVLKLLPRDRGEQEYRIKSSTEVYERIAKESELSPHS